MNELYDDINYMIQLLDQRSIKPPITLNCYVLGDNCTEDDLLDDIYVLSEFIDEYVYYN